MTAPSPARPPHPLTAPERDLIRRELHPRFSSLPSIAEGLFLRTWRSGPQAGQPKLPPIVRGMIERGLLDVRADPNGGWPRAYFTPAGIAALRELARDKRSLPPARYAHIRRELGLDVQAGETETGGDDGVVVAE